MYKNYMNSNISPTQIELDNIARMTQGDKKMLTYLGVLGCAGLTAGDGKC